MTLGQLGIIFHSTLKASKEFSGEICAFVFV